jgi:hypothetical protein
MHDMANARGGVSKWSGDDPQPSEWELLAIRSHCCGINFLGDEDNEWFTKYLWLAAYC